MGIEIEIDQFTPCLRGTKKLEKLLTQYMKKYCRKT